MYSTHQYTQGALFTEEQHIGSRFGLSDSTVLEVKDSGKVFELSGIACGRCFGHGGD